MKILFISDNFPPEVNAPASRTFEHCKEWVKLGHKVTVITCCPNFPGGKPFQGYKNNLYSSCYMEGIKVVRVWTLIHENKGFLLRTADHLSFMFSSFFVSFFLKKPDVVIATSPQFFSACAGWLVSVFRRSPFVFEVRDLWPESIKAVGLIKQGLLYSLLEKIELFLYRRAEKIVVVSCSFKNDLIRRGVPEDKIHVCFNGIDPAVFFLGKRPSALIRKLGLEKSFVVGYIGTLGMAHGLEVLIRSAMLLGEVHPHENVKILIIGSGAEAFKLKQMAVKNREKNIIFVDQITKRDIPSYYALLDLFVVHLTDSEAFEKVIPSKLFEGMAMGVPILHGVRGESAEMVIKNGVGVTFEPENHIHLSEQILYLKSKKTTRLNMSKNGIKTSKYFERAKSARELLEVVKSATQMGEYE